MRSHATEVSSNKYEISNTKLIEIICCILHPFAVVLIWMFPGQPGTARAARGLSGQLELVAGVDHSLVEGDAHAQG
jgi:hypothetical protein